MNVVMLAVTTICAHDHSIDLTGYDTCCFSAFTRVSRGHERHLDENVMALGEFFKI